MTISRSIAGAQIAAAAPQVTMVSTSAVRVAVPQDTMVVGLKWYNGSAAGAYPQFLVIAYPANYSPPQGQTGLGVGYANTESADRYFVTGDGSNWYEVTRRCQVLLKPVLADRTEGVEVKSRHGEAAAEHALGLFTAPNPFNPATRIDLYLAEATTGKVRIVDLRGYVVAELHSGPLAQGRNAFVWEGRDGGGRGVASGVYWVLAETTDQRLVKKVLLVK